MLASVFGKGQWMKVAASAARASSTWAPVETLNTFKLATYLQTVSLLGGGKSKVALKEATCGLAKERGRIENMDWRELFAHDTAACAEEYGDGTSLVACILDELECGRRELHLELQSACRRASSEGVFVSALDHARLMTEALRYAGLEAGGDMSKITRTLCFEEAAVLADSSLLLASVKAGPSLGVLDAFTIPHVVSVDPSKTKQNPDLIVNSEMVGCLN